MPITGADNDHPTTEEESVQIRRLFGDPLLIPEEWFEWLKRKLEMDPPTIHINNMIGAPDCCGDGSGDAGQVVKDRAESWYGLGDGSTADSSNVNNYGIGADATFRNGSIYTFSGTPGTVGASVPWGLAADAGSLIGYPFVPTTYPSAPDSGFFVETNDHISSTIDWTVNLWVQRRVSDADAFGWSQYVQVPFVFASYYYVFLYGRQTSAGAVGARPGILIGTDSVGPIGPTDPHPASDLTFSMFDNTATGQSISAGSILDDELWHMVTATFNGTSKLMSFYVDAALFGTDTYTGSGTGVDLDPGSAVYPLIGSGANGSCIDGLEDECGVWFEELSAGDITDLFAG